MQPVIQKDVTEHAMRLQNAMNESLNRYRAITPDIHRTSAALSMLLSRAYSLVISTLTKHTQEFGLSHAKFSTLLLLYCSEDYRLTMTEISQQKHVTRTNITKLVDALENDGYVERLSDPFDRRSSIITLSDKGLTTITDRLQQYWDKQKWMFDDFPVYIQEQICRVLYKLIANFMSKDSDAEAGTHNLTEQAVQMEQRISRIMDKYRSVTPTVQTSSAALPILLERAYNSMMSLLNNLTLEFGLSHAKFTTLLLLYRIKDRPLTMTEISQLKRVSKTSVTKLVEALERDGMVIREKDPADRRSSIIFLSEKGFAHLFANLQNYWDKQKWMLDGLSEAEQQFLISILYQIVAIMTVKDESLFIQEEAKEAVT